MGRSIYLSGMACFLGMMSWKGAPVGPDVRSIDAHGVECFSIHDVEAVASIHQHLGEPLRADDRVDHKRVPSRLQDALWVVGSVRGDVKLQPLEERWYGWLGRVDLATHKLSATLGVVSRRPIEDQEASV